MKKLVIFLFSFICNGLFATAIDVATIYYPHCHSNLIENKSEHQEWTNWAIIKDAKPIFKGHLQPKCPYLNYPNSVNPKHVSLEIDLAKNNGIDVFIFSWHWNNSVQEKKGVIEQGFLKAPNNEKMKFAVMWENQNIKTSEQDVLNVIDHFINNYFNKPNYWKIKDEYYVSLTSPNTLITQLGGVEKTKRLFAKINAKLQKANLTKIHWAGNCRSKNEAEKLAQAGFSSTFVCSVSPIDTECYDEKITKKDILFDYSEIMKASEKIWKGMLTSSLPNIPTITQGYDATPLNKTIKSAYCPIVLNNTSDKFEKLLLSAKSHIKTNSLPAVIISAWNNWSYGNAVFPEYIEGMNFLRAINRVFTPNRKTLTFATTYIRNKLCELPQPDVHLKYATYGKNSIDFWKAKNGKKLAPTIVYYHGGGWTHNSNLDARLIKLFKLRDYGFNIAAVSYRFTQEVKHKVYPPVKAPMQDCANALALIVEKAQELGVDTSRISLTGGSAGACSSLWIALNAGKKLDSGRIIPNVKMVSVIVPQTSLDPVQMREWIPNSKYGAHAFNLGGFNEFVKKRNSILSTINEYSPYALLSPEKNKTKFYIFNKYKPCVNQKVKDPTHASAFCIKFKEKCDDMKIPCETIFVKDDWNASIENMKKNL